MAHGVESQLSGAHSGFRATRRQSESVTLFATGGGGTFVDCLHPLFYEQFSRGLAVYGHSVLCGLYGDGWTFGNDASTDAMDVYRASVSAPTIDLFGGSMGAAQCFNYARRFLHRVNRIGVIIPACDLEDMRAFDRGGIGLQTRIEAAYGGNAAWQLARPTHNPVEFAPELADIDICIWYASNDPYCLPATALAFAAAHGNTRLVNLGAVGHNGGINNVTPAMIAEWFVRRINP